MSCGSVHRRNTHAMVSMLTSHSYDNEAVEILEHGRIYVISGKLTRTRF